MDTVRLHIVTLSDTPQNGPERYAVISIHLSEPRARFLASTRPLDALSVHSVYLARCQLAAAWFLPGDVSEHDCGCPNSIRYTSLVIKSSPIASYPLTYSTATIYFPALHTPLGKVTKNSAAAKKAKASAKAVAAGNFSKSVRKVRHSVRFHRPRTLHQPRTPKYQRKSVTSDARLDTYTIFVRPLNTENAMKCIEEYNTIVFLVHVKANKNHIKDAFRKLYDVKPIKVNTLIRYVDVRF